MPRAVSWLTTANEVTGNPEEDREHPQSEDGRGRQPVNEIARERTRAREQAGFVDGLAPSTVLRLWVLTVFLRIPCDFISCCEP